MKSVGKYSFIISILFSTSTTLIAQTITSKDPDNTQQSQSLSISIAGQNTHFQQGSPTLTSINPDSAHQGHSLSVTITGQNTHFQQASATVASKSPDNAQQGQGLSVTITGHNSLFQQGTPTGIWFSQGSPTVNIYANSYSASSDASVNASFDIPSDAPLGVWNVNANISIDGWLKLIDGFTIIKRPVLLVHGIMSSSRTWNTVIPYLEANGYELDENMFKIDLFPFGFGNIKGYGRQILNKLEEITSKPGITEVDIVAHSMGGLASRWCIQKLGGDNDVGKLIMLGTPNHGSLGFWPWMQFRVWVPPQEIVPCSVSQMHPMSDFLAQLNYNEPNFNSNSWLIKDDQIDQILSRYTVLAGSGFETGEMFCWSAYSGDAFFTKSTYNGDGAVGVRSAKLTNVPCYQYNVKHEPLNDDSNVIRDVIHLLNNEPIVHGVACQPSPRDSNEPSLWQAIRIIRNDLILKGVIKTFEVILDYGLPIAKIGVGYPGSELDLTLITPSGTVIDPVYASSDPNIDFTYDINCTDNLGNNYDQKYYTISNPEPGTWNVEVAAVNVPPEGEKFSVGAMLNSNLTLLARTRDNIYSFPPGEPIILEAFLWDGELLNYPGTEVEGTVEKPDGTKEIIAFRDDGTNGDSIAGDGVFTYNYTNTMANGMYYADINANNDSFARQTQLIFSINMLLDGVNFLDYAVFADRWMDQNCTHASWCNGADLNKSGSVDWNDLAQLAKHWLEGTTP